MDILSFDSCQPSSLGKTPVSLNSVSFLTRDEKAHICERFKGSPWHRNSQVLWSGSPREYAQRLADDHEMQTLTTAMGNLIAPYDSHYLK